MSRLELEVVTRFLYTDEASLPVSLAPPGWLAVLELANRLVLPRLVTLLEREAISSLGARLEAGAEVTTEALQLLQPCQVRASHGCIQYLPVSTQRLPSIYLYLFNIYPVSTHIYSTQYSSTSTLVSSILISPSDVQRSPAGCLVPGPPRPQLHQPRQPARQVSGEVTRSRGHEVKRSRCAG